MTKVVCNGCYGGFGLSKEACKRYWEIKGQPVWIEEDSKFKSLKMFTVWLVAPEDRIEEKNGGDFYAMSIDERIEYNKKYTEQIWVPHYVDRHDPVLVQVVEELARKLMVLMQTSILKKLTAPIELMSMMVWKP